MWMNKRTNGEEGWSEQKSLLNSISILFYAILIVSSDFWNMKALSMRPTIKRIIFSAFNTYIVVTFLLYSFTLVPFVSLIFFTLAHILFDHRSISVANNSIFHLSSILLLLLFSWVFFPFSSTSVGNFFLSFKFFFSLCLRVCVCIFFFFFSKYTCWTKTK